MVERYRSALRLKVTRYALEDSDVIKSNFQKIDERQGYHSEVLWLCLVWQTLDDPLVAQIKKLRRLKIQASQTLRELNERIYS